MAGKRNTRKVRKNGSGKTILSRAAGPVGRVVHAVGNSANEIVKYTGDVIKRSVKGAHKIGGIWVKNANNAVKNLTKKSNRRSRH
jgi:CobQ-like glutamine amidotransferase family enzyme